MNINFLAITLPLILITNIASANSNSMAKRKPAQALPLMCSVKVQEIGGFPAQWSDRTDNKPVKVVLNKKLKEKGISYLAGNASCGDQCSIFVKYFGNSNFSGYTIRTEYISDPVGGAVSEATVGYSDPGDEMGPIVYSSPKFKMETNCNYN